MIIDNSVTVVFGATRRKVHNTMSGRHFVSPFTKVIAQARFSLPSLVPKHDRVRVAVNGTSIKLLQGLVEMKPGVCGGKGSNENIAFWVGFGDKVLVHDIDRIVINYFYVLDIVEVGKEQLVESLMIAANILNLVHILSLPELSPRTVEQDLAHLPSTWVFGNVVVLQLDALVGFNVGSNFYQKTLLAT